MEHLINALREAAPSVAREYCSPFGDLMDTAADAIKRLQAERNELISAARDAIPEGEHPKDETPSNWAWQIRGLGADRNAAYGLLSRRQGGFTNDQLRAEFAKKLPGVNATERDMSVFALGIEVGSGFCGSDQQDPDEYQSDIQAAAGGLTQVAQEG